MVEIGMLKANAPNQITTHAGETLVIMPLGAGCEVGRSCIYLECKGRKIMLDSGIHPARDGIQSLPYFDAITPRDVELMLVTHFHVDHCASLPYFSEKTEFQGKIYMTHPTKSIYQCVLQDFVKVSGIPAGDEQLFDEQDIENTLGKISLIDYHQEVEMNGIKFTAFRAGHVLGASMFLIEIDGIKILYTGDYSREEDRHLKPAEFPDCEVDVLIVESTYGVAKHEPRERRETNFTKYVHEIVARGGKCLMPAFALGRAQELLLILNEYWQKHPELSHVPIYYQGNLAKRALDVFNEHRNMMGDKLRMELEAGNNPFKFETYDKLDAVAEATTPLVIMASPGMLQNGPSRELFVKWAPDKKNGVVFTGYSVEGTLAKKVMDTHKTIQVGEQMINREMEVQTISFSAHADFQHTKDYVEILQPPNIVLVHGDQNEMGKLKNQLHIEFKNKFTILCPRNCQQVRFKLISKKSAKIIGKLAQQVVLDTTKQLQLTHSKVSPQKMLTMPDQQIDTNMENEEEKKEAEEEENFVTVEGVLVKQDFEQLVMDESEVNKYTGLKCVSMQQSLYIPFTFNIEVLAYFLANYYSDVRTNFRKKEHMEMIEEQDMATPQTVCRREQAGSYDIEFVMQGEISLFYYQTNQMLQMIWETSPKNDMIADSLCLLILQINEKPTPQLVALMNKTSHGGQEVYISNKLEQVLSNHFDSVQALEGESGYKIKQNGKQVTIETTTFSVVQSDCDQLREAVDSILLQFSEAAQPSSIQTI